MSMMPLTSVIQLHQEGKTPREIGEMYGVTELTVRGRLVRAGEHKPEIGLTKGPRGFTADQEQQICTEYKDGGYSIYRLSRRHNTTYETIRATLVRNDIKIITKQQDHSQSAFKGHKQLDTDEIVRLHEAGATPNQLANMFSCSLPTIRARLKSVGAYKPRPVGQNSNAKGKHTDPHGYVFISDKEKIANFPFKDMCRSARGRGKSVVIAEHRMVMAEHLGRALSSTEQVHHKDGDRTNNTIENLQLQQTQHGKGAAFRCRCCGSEDVEAVDLA